MNSFEHKRGVFRGRGYQGCYDGIDCYTWWDGRLHFYQRGEWICWHDLMRHGLALAKWTLKNEKRSLV